MLVTSNGLSSGSSGDIGKGKSFSEWDTMLIVDNDISVSGK